MTMTRQHFALIAEVINRAFPDDPYSQIGQEELAVRFADALSRTNPNFNRDRFLRACVVEG